jgi:hypothetical protein
LRYLGIKTAETPIIAECNNLVVGSHCGRCAAQAAAKGRGEAATSRRSAHALR